MTTPDALALADAAFQEGARGDFSKWASALDALGHDPSSEAARAWTLALSAQGFFADLPEARLPTLDDFEGVITSPDPAAREAAALACGVAERSAVLGFSSMALDAWIELHQQLVTADSGESDMWLTAARCWREIMSGSYDHIDAWAIDVGSRARAAGLPALTIEAMSLRALAAACRRDLDEATKLARRASRMARTEAMPQQEYLANLTLARVRRLAGQPYLAARILNALHAVAPSAWRPWLTWELLLAQGESRTEDAPMPRSRAGRAADGLRGLLRSARTGDRAAFEHCVSDIRDATSGFAELSRELGRLVALLDPMRTEEPSVAAWLSGHIAETPDGLHGICGADGAPGSLEGDVAHVYVSSDGLSRRVLSPGTNLVDATRIPRLKRPQLRTDSTLSVLALAGADGLDEDALFHQVYGFAFEPALHRGVRNTLNTRMRSRLGESGAIEREGGRISLVPLSAFVVPDPRCSPPPEHTLLAVLGKMKHMSASRAAEMLGVPLRTVQRALAELAEDGACRAVKVGRGLEYVLEDTTFSEPTTHF
jgi:hypothetical protein